MAPSPSVRHAPPPAARPCASLRGRLTQLGSQLLVALLSLPIRLYRRLLSPLLPPACRFEPSCSRYALEALARHGPLRGLLLTVWRLGRCHPWGGSGLDPVPPPRPPRAGR